MIPNTLHIKNMVCYRCVLAVEDILRNESIPFHSVGFGEVYICAELAENERMRLIKRCESIGLELIDNRTDSLVENIKQLVIKQARNEISEGEKRMKLSQYISGKVNHEYTYLSSLFSSVEGRTIENYFIEQRIEKVKELMVNGQSTLSQIAFDLEYSSVAHLSTQFKKITGLTPTYFKQTGMTRSKSLDKI